MKIIYGIRRTDVDSKQLIQKHTGDETKGDKSFIILVSYVYLQNFFYQRQ